VLASFSNLSAAADALDVPQLALSIALQMVKNQIGHCLFACKKERSFMFKTFDEMFLASEANRVISVQALFVDGGAMLTG
jgi:hypothetical protein